MAWKSRKSVIPYDDILNLILDKYGTALTIKQLADFAGIGLSKAYQIKNRGLIPTKYIDGTFRFCAVDVAKWWRK